MVCVIFGAHMKPKALSAPARIVVRDARFTDEYRSQYQERLRDGKPVLEEKTENIVNRKSGTAEHPRTGERILPRSRFAGEILLHIYQGDDAAKMTKEIRHSLGIVQNFSGLGAGGSRGYGRTRFDKVREETISLSGITL